MSWTCPRCEKQFRNTNQWHSCYVINLEKHFKNKSDKTKNLFEKIWQPLKKLEGVSLNPVKSSVQVKAGATFLSIKPKKEHLEIEFQLAEEYSEFPVYRIVRISGKRLLHFAIIEETGDITPALIKVLKKSYKLVYQQD